MFCNQVRDSVGDHSVYIPMNHELIQVLNYFVFQSFTACIQKMLNVSPR